MGYRAGWKTRYKLEYGWYFEDYDLYCAYESVSDTIIIKMFNDKGKEMKDIPVGCEDDCSEGKHSLIDCLYALKHHENIKDIVIEDMTREEIDKIFEIKK